MWIQAIELKHWRVFGAPFRLAGLRPGINLLVGPNETGKSTLVEAIGRLLFDRPKTLAAQKLRSWGSDLPAEGALEFATANKLYRIEKRFHASNGQALLKEYQASAWTELCRDEATQDFIHSLIGGQKVGRGLSEPEQWGLFRFLWALQDQSLVPTELDQELQSRLGPSLFQQSLASSGQMQELLREVEHRYLVWYTEKSGKESKKSPLLSLREEVSRLQEKIAQLEAALQRTRELAVHVKEELQKEQEFAKRIENSQAELKNLEKSRREFEDLRFLRLEAENALQSAEAAEAAYHVMQHQSRQALARENQLRQLTDEARLELDALLAQSQETESELAAAEQAVKQAASELHENETTRQNISNQIHLMRLDFEEKARAAQAARTRAQQITTQDLDALKELEAEISKMQATLQTESFVLELSPDKTLTIRSRLDAGPLESEELPSKKPKRYEGVQLSLVLPGVATIQVGRPGAAKQAAERIAELIRQKSEKLATLQAPQAMPHETPPEQEQQTAQQLRQTLAQKESALLECETACQESARRLKTLEAQLDSTRHRLFELDRAKGALESRLEHNQKALAEASSARTAQASSHSVADQAILAEKTQKAREKLEALALLPKLDPKTELDTLKSALEHENRRWEEHLLRRHSLEKELDSLSIQGLWDQLTEARELLAIRQKELESESLRATATQHLKNILEEAQEEARRKIGGPIQAWVTERAKEVLGQTFASVQFNDSLKLEEVSRTGFTENAPLEEFSRGTRDILGLLVRLGIAEMVSSEERQLTVLDDVLVHADDSRRRRILKILQEVSSKTQILICTCHHEHYAGLGDAAQTIELETLKQGRA